MSKQEKGICTLYKEKGPNEKRHQCHTDAAYCNEGPGCFLASVGSRDRRFDCIHYIPSV